MRVLNRFEYNLASIARAIVGQLGVSRVKPMLLEKRERPACLTRHTVDLVSTTLGQGVALLLARPQTQVGKREMSMSGGWSREGFLRDGKLVRGRVWERTAPQDLGLAFSPHSLDFLIWLTSQAAHLRMTWEPVGELTDGDRLLIFLAYRQFRTLDSLGHNWQSSRLISENGLCQLAFPQDFAGVKLPPDFEPWVAGPLSYVLEVWQRPLSENWLAVERRKGDLVQVPQMLALGRAQQQILDAFLETLQRHQRRDLARFLLLTYAELLGDDPPESRWTEKLNMDGMRMRERMEAYQAAFTFLRSFERLHQWQQESRTIGYFDEGYSVAQAWQSEWQAMNTDLLHQRARAIVRSRDPLTSSSPHRGQTGGDTAAEQNQ